MCSFNRSDHHTETKWLLGLKLENIILKSIWFDSQNMTVSQQEKTIRFPGMLNQIQFPGVRYSHICLINWTIDFGCSFEFSVYWHLNAIWLFAAEIWCENTVVKFKKMRKQKHWRVGITSEKWSLKSTLFLIVVCFFQITGAHSWTLEFARNSGIW